MDRGAWWATVHGVLPVHGVTKSRTQLSNYHTHTFNSASTPARTPPLIFDSLPPSLEESYPGPCLSYYHFPLLPSSIHAPRLVVLNTNHSAQVLCLTAGMRVVCRVFLWVVRAETEAESRSQAKDDAVGVWYGHGVCGGGGGGGPACGACGVCGGRAETDRVRQRITCMDGYPASSACVF